MGYTRYTRTWPPLHYSKRKLFEQMRITNRVVKTRETKDVLETIVTERIVEDDQCRLLPMIAVVLGASGTCSSEVEAKCNICTQVFALSDAPNHTACPACGSKDVSLV